MSKVLVIQNSEGEGLGSFADELKQAEVAWDLIKAYAGEPIPTGIDLDERGYRGLMILGGPMSAIDEKGYPFIADELRLIRAALDRKLPMLNICLGAQLLARACNMSLKINGQKEVGWHPVELIHWYTQRNPLFFQLPQNFTTFHWHQDTFEIPSEGYRLARSEAYPHQAFCFGGNAYGIQFHPEITKEMIEEWIARDSQRKDRFLSEDEATQILAQADQFLPEQKKIAHKIIYGWVTLLRPVDYRRPAVDESETAPKEAEAKTESTEGGTAPAEPQAESASAADAKPAAQEAGASS
jgi:GMP synthase-like glutamine amidotransferase